MSRRRSAAAAQFTEAAPVFAALGDPTRLKLVARLCVDGPLSIARLSDGAGVTRQAVSKHLQALGTAGLVQDTWQGRDRIFSLDTARLEKARRTLDAISDHWDETLDRLRAFVEADR